MDVQLPDGTIIKDVPEGTSKAELVAKLAKNGYDISWYKPEPKVLTPDEIRERQVRASKSVQRSPMQPAIDVLAGLGGTIGGVANLPSKLLDSPMLQSEFSRLADRADKSSKSYITGQVFDPAAMAIGGGALTKAYSMFPKSPVIAGMLGGGAGGAAVGAAQEDGSMLGGGVAGTVLGGLFPALGRGIGAAINYASGSAPAVRGRKILEETLGDKAAQIRALWQSAPEGLTAAQAAERAGSTKLSALGERAKDNLSQEFSDIAARQQEALLEAIRKMAAGATQTEAKQSAEQSRKALNAITAPMRETELAAANAARKYGGPLQDEADRLGAAASSKVQDVRRMQELGGRAEARNIAWNPKWPLDGEAEAQRMARTSGAIEGDQASRLAAKAEAVGAKSASDSLILGEGSRFAQSRADSLAAYGLKPLDTSKIVSEISKRSNDPSYAAQDTTKKVMSKVAEEIQEWEARNGGVIDAEALYSIQKNAVNEAVRSLMSGASPKAQNKAAAGIAESLRPMFNDALEAAGATGWKDYLKTYSEGMKVINQQKLGAKAMQLLETSPKQFIELVRGNKPDVVKKIFETEFDFTKAMGGKNPVFQSVADELQRDRNLKRLAIEGKGDLAGVLSENAAKFRIPNPLNPKIALANRALDVAEESLNAKAMARVYSAMKSGKDATELMNALSAAEKSYVLDSLIKGRFTVPAMQAVQAGEQ